MPRIQLLASSSSPPKPTVQPTLVPDVSKDTGPMGLSRWWSISANATPPFRYHIQPVPMVTPMRGVNVASHFTSVVHRSFRKPSNGPKTVFLTPDQVPLASTPRSQLEPISQL